MQDAREAAMSTRTRNLCLLITALGLAVIILRAGNVSGNSASPRSIVLPVVMRAIDYDVRLDDGATTPHVLAVSTGTTVRWANEDSIARTLAAVGGAFTSPSIPPGGRYTWQATSAGIYPYSSAQPPALEGAVVVSANGAADWFDGRSAAEAYLDSCSGCHGLQRQGGIGPALVPARLTQNDAFYFNTIRNGRPGTAMPGWRHLLADAEVWLMLGFLRGPVDQNRAEWGMDEIIASRDVLIDESTLPSEPTHAGNLDNLMLVTEREAERIAVVDGDSHTLLGRIDASYRAHGYAFDPTNDRWAYNIGRDGWLFRIDLYTLQPTIKVRVGLDARGLAISDDGQYVIAGNFDPATAVILRADTLEPLKVIATEGYDMDGRWVQSRVAITSDVAPDLVGPYFIIALKEAGQMWRIDYSRPDFPIDKLEDVGRILHDGFLSPDNRRFYVASQEDNWMAVVDVANWTLVGHIDTGDTPHPGSGATWQAGGQAYGATVHAGEGLVTVWNLADNTIVATIPTSGPGLFVRAHDDNPYIWADTMFAATPSRIYAIDKTTYEVVHVITDGIQTLHPELTHDGRHVYISDWQGGVVRVYDALTFALEAEIEGLTTPTGIFNTSRRYEKLGH